MLDAKAVMRSYKPKSLVKNNLVRNVSTLLSGSVLAQCIGLAVMPILTRQFDSNAFGTFGVFMALAGIVATLCTGRFNLGVMLPKDEHSAIAMLKLSLMVTSGFVMFCLVINLFAASISSFLNAPDLAHYLLFLPLLTLLLGWQQSYEVWSGRQKAFKSLALATVIGACAGNALKLAGGYWLFGLSGEASDQAGYLIGGSLMAIAVTSFFLVARDFSPLKQFNTISFAELRRLAAEYRQLPIYRAPKDFANAVSQNLPTMLLASFFGVGVVGLYVLAERMLKVPGIFVGAALRKVLYQKYAEQRNQSRRIFGSLVRAISALALLSVVPFGMIATFGPELFSLLFGSEWSEAGRYGTWLALWMFFAFINAPVVVCIPVFGLEKVFFYFELMLMVLRALSIIIASYLIGEPLIAVACFCAVSAAGNALLIFLALVAIRKKERTYECC